MYKYYGWENIQSLLVSFLPSIKYKMTTMLISVSGITAMVNMLFGLKVQTFVALLVLLSAELVTGIYCSVWIRVEPFQSNKMWRFFFKTGVFFIILYVVKQLHNEFADTLLFSDIFNWLYYFLFTFSILEILISVLENYAEISGKAKDYYTSYLKRRISKLFGND